MDVEQKDTIAKMRAKMCHLFVQIDCSPPLGSEDKVLRLEDKR